MENLEKIVNEMGGQAKLAEKAGVTKQAVSKWIRQHRIPADRVISVSCATGWRITPHQLRPDIYPNSVDGLPTDNQ